MEVEYFEPIKQWDLVNREGKTMLVYAIDHGGYAKSNQDKVRKIMRKTIEKGTDWGGDIIVPVVIGKTEWSEEGAKVPFTSPGIDMDPEHDYFYVSEYFDGWIWANYERLVLFIEDPKEIAYYKELVEMNKKKFQI